MSLKNFDLRPLYLQVVDDFIGRIISGEWPAGQFIASETEISRELGLSIGTVRRAFDILDQYGLLDRSQGKGTLILDASGEEASRRFVTFVDEDGEKISGTLELLDTKLTKAPPQIAKTLMLEEGAEILQLTRQRVYNGRVFLTEKAYSPFVPPAASQTASGLKEAGQNRWFAHSLATRMQENLRPILADKADAAAFGIAVNSPILELQRVIYSYNNKPLEQRTAHCYLGTDLRYESV
ncbi:GntR family transcriptional regulator [Aureimonas fodinaquatilis]|uniref:GntR family transcriptional regulator n=1 Tax=Aureimonas fodinaquatilis TaxID=2565783 RepID=A0A5B0DQ67_9HYPH|nr:GntR family transcriptional regulator [Aureimonas fodinaquatilis]KAA0968957.1 GntR family transcriptional regulator [Aureimonas fodinaquatilis]